MINPKVAPFADLPRVHFSIFVITAGRQLYPPAFVVTILAQTFRIELGVCVFALCDHAYLFPICSLLYNWRLRVPLADLLDRAYLLV
jgi:hypothetical protein